MERIGSAAASSENAPMVTPRTPSWPSSGLSPAAAGLLAEVVQLIRRVHLCANLPTLDDKSLMDKAAAWSEVLRDVPPQHLGACYDRAVARHTGQYAPTAYEVRQGWLELGEDLAYRARMAPPLDVAGYLPGPAAVSLAESNTVEGVLAELARAWNEWPAAGRIVDVLTWGKALRTAYPEIPAPAMRLQLQKIRMSGEAPTLAAAVALLLAEAAPAPAQEG